MAEGLIFPIGFDLDKAVEQASNDWKSTYASKLESALEKRAINIKLKLDTKNIDGLDAVKQRLAQLKIEPITPDTKAAIKELASELQSLAKALETLQKFSKFSATTKAQMDAAKLKVQEERANAQAALAAQRTAKAEENLAAAKLKTARAADVQKRSSLNSYNSQITYLDRIIKRLAVYWSLQQVGDFLSKVRDVTAEFELQRVSLGAIIGDQMRANQLFSEIKAYALKSPVKIMDLTKYTKQLAAYKTGIDDLFETTKKLTDVSVGLGVSMDRVVLAYGQVRATGYLRASEVRQFTEMGVPIVEELAAKLTKMNGQLVTAADVMAKISERGISFQLVKEVFDDMTSSGGMFYNMQEKQGNTLFGMWAKLGDAASVMYDQIGNTKSVNDGMKSLIQLLTDLMRNWQQVARGIVAVSLVIAGLIVRKKMLAVETTKLTAITATYNKRLLEAEIRIATGTKLTRTYGYVMKAFAATLRGASVAAAAFGTSLRAIKAAMVQTGIGALIVGLGYLVDKLIFTKSAASEARDAIDEVMDETSTEQTKSVRNFEYLAKKAVESAYGSREQKDALEELQRTYKDILPQELLEIEYLKKLNGNYDSLTMSIQAYIAERQKQKAIDAVIDQFGPEKRKYEQKVTTYMRDELQMSEQEIARFWVNFEKYAKDKGLKPIEAIKKALGDAGLGDAKYNYIADNILSAGTSPFQLKGDIQLYIKALQDEQKELDYLEEKHKANTEATNAFAEAQEKSAKRIKNVTFIDENGKAVDNESDLGQQMLKNFEIKEITNILKNGFKQAGLTWDEEFGVFVNHVNSSKSEFISTLNFEAITDKIVKALNNKNLTDAQRNFLSQLLTLAQNSRKRYEEIIPSDPVVRAAQARFRLIAQAAGGFRQQYAQYLMQSGEDMASYTKRLKDEIEKLKNRVKSLLYVQQSLAKSAVIKLLFKGVANNVQKEIDEANKTIKILEQNLKTMPNFSSGGTKKTKTRKTKTAKDDPRLSILNEMVSTLKQINKEYDDLAKKEGATKALEDVGSNYAKMFKYMAAMSSKYKFNLPTFSVPTDTKTLIGYLKKIKAAMSKVPKSEKNVLSLGVEIGKINYEETRLRIEKELSDLSERISRTKVAKEFFDKILDQTGDLNLAERITFSVYGGIGTDVKGTMSKYVSKLFEQVSAQVPTDIVKPFKVDFTQLEQYVKNNADKLGGIESDTYKELIKIAQEGQKDLAKAYEGYQKDLEVAKSYADKRIQLARDTANKIIEIQNSNLPEEDKENLVAGYKRREVEQAAKLEYEAFKETPMYVQLFSDLDSASTLMLRNMSSMLDSIKGKWGAALDPTQLKEIQSRFEEIGEQLVKRNPFRAIGDAIRNIKALDKQYGSLSNVEKRLSDATEKLLADKAAIQLALKNERDAKENLDEVMQDSNADDKSVKAAKDRLNAATAVVGMMAKQVDLTEEEAKLLQQIIDKYKQQKKKISDGSKSLSTYIGLCKEALSSVRAAVEEWTALGDDELWNGIMDGLESMADGAMSAADAVGAFQSGDPFSGITKSVSAVAKVAQGVGQIFNGAKLKKANKEIEKQQKILDNLEYTYSRLEELSDKLFGTTYIANYQSQIKNLQDQIIAKQKQLAAEQSKGKKKSKDAIKEYEEQIRDLGDQIADMQKELIEQFAGGSKQDIARQMAQSWVDARASMSSTFDAIKGDYQDMIKTMIVEGAAANIIDAALAPMWNEMNAMIQKNDINGAIDALINGMDSALAAANSGMEVLWKALEVRGYDMKQLLKDSKESADDYTGIKRSVATATSEEINANTTALNTQNFYISQIHANVLLIAQSMQKGGSTPSSAVTGWTDWQQQAMDNYMAIQRNTFDTVTECRRIAQSCESVATYLSRIIKVKGSTVGANVFIN